MRSIDLAATFEIYSPGGAKNPNESNGLAGSGLRVARSRSSWRAGGSLIMEKEGTRRARRVCDDGGWGVSRPETDSSGGRTLPHGAASEGEGG
jgi:hypothetical protein